MKRLTILLLSVLLVYSLVSCGKGAHLAHSDAAADAPIYLVAGLDDASGNTDVLLLLGYREGRLSVVQIPRDTYCDTGLSQNKINQIYAASVGQGMSPEASMKRLADTVSEVFAVSVDGYIALTTRALSKIVDRLGGVEITLPEAITLDDGERTLTLPAGRHTLTGEDALLFIRHRKGYLTGDIARMDAQKLFLGGVLGAMKTGLGVEDILALLPLVESDVITDQTLMDVAKTAIKYMPDFKKSTIVYLTLPGEATQSASGLWYYVVNKKCAADALKKHMEISPIDFDPRRRLTDADNVAFENIYEDNHMSYREYGEEELSEIRIPRG